ncbi:MAG: hypothetical protein HN560_07145 [Anaerolineae bacterium]|jgi:hypothetical protein|nr:hypothetical protein [Anaerolineae bacterium]
MKINKKDIFKNGLWLTLPPLLFSLSLMNYLPPALTPALFNKDIPELLAIGENITRSVVFALPVFFSIGFSTKTQKRGLAFYLAGIVFYYFSYAALILFPDSVWSNSMVGVVATAYTNFFWMIGLSLLGEKFYFPTRLPYRPVYFITPVVLFLVLHTTHAVLVYQRSF